MQTKGISITYYIKLEQNSQLFASYNLSFPVLVWENKIKLENSDWPAAVIAMGFNIVSGMRTY